MRALLRPVLLVLAFASAALPLRAAGDFRLVMVEQSGCSYCLQWHTEIGPIYPKTPEGAVAPLETVQLRAPLPDGIALNSPPVFTPTFILLRDGAEVGRIEGYPGEDFFWGLLGMMLRQGGHAPQP